MKETLGEYIHSLRVGADMTLTKMAAALDIDQSTLSKIENRKRPVTMDVLVRLADIFNLDIELLKREYFSEKIAEMIYPQQDTEQVLKLAEEKVKYFRVKKVKSSLN